MVIKVAQRLEHPMKFGRYRFDSYLELSIIPISTQKRKVYEFFQNNHEIYV